MYAMWPGCYSFRDENQNVRIMVKRTARFSYVKDLRN